MTQKPTFDQLINESEIPVLVDFHADWCQPCKILSPTIKEIASKHADRVKVIKIDVDRNPAVSGKYEIRGVPTLILFHKGKILWRQSGVVPANVIEQNIMQVA